MTKKASPIDGQVQFGEIFGSKGRPHKVVEGLEGKGDSAVKGHHQRDDQYRQPGQSQHSHHWVDAGLRACSWSVSYVIRQQDYSYRRCAKY